MQDTKLNIDSLNNSEVDTPKKHKKSKKIYKSLENDTILDECTESRKAVKRENSIPLDNIIETETKKRKKHRKKSKEFDSDSEIEKKLIESEKEHIYEKQSNTDLVSNNLEDTVSKKHRKKKRASMKISDSEAENHIVKIKIEKQDPDRITNESQIVYSETQNFKKNIEISKRVKREVSIESDIFEKERKKSPKKHTVSSRDSQSKLVKIKTEDDIINDVTDTGEKERKKSPKKLARDSDSEIRIKSENITNDINNISQTIKHDPIKPKEEKYMKYNISTMDTNLNNSDFDHVSKKSKKKKTSILSDLELE